MKVVRHPLLLPLLICFLFFLCYSILSVIKHNHYLSGYDLGVVHQVTWEYSRFKPPISTPFAYPFTSVLTDHIEFIYMLLSPFYWVFPDARTLIVLQNLFVAASGIAVYLLARKKKVKPFVAMCILISYFLFYGIQFALWSDVHSLVFGVAFLAWFIYFLETENRLWSIVFLLLTISSKEDLGLLTFLVSGVYFIRTHKREPLLYMAISALYLFAVFFIYFPHFTKDGYRFQNKSGLFSNARITGLTDSATKRSTILYSLGSFGFLPLLSPLNLIPAIGDLAHYFLLGNDYVARAQGIFGHYRSSLSLLLLWPTILALGKYKKLNKWYVGVYIVICMLVVQYMLHLPLSYVSKHWFWTEPQSVRDINSMLPNIPSDASIVTQVNIVPHIGARSNIFLLWPDERSFTKNSPCGKPICKWFRWVGHPTYLLVDTSSDWDIRYFLQNREDFVQAVNNIDKAKIVTLYKKQGNTRLYKVLKSPK